MTDTPAAVVPSAAPVDVPVAPAQQAAWHQSAGFDADTQAWVTNRGYDKLEAQAALTESIRSHRALEKHTGVPADQLLRLPKDLNAATPEELAGIYDRLGRPKEAKDYELDVADGSSPDDPFLGWAKENFHKTGLTASQAKNLTKSWNEYVGKIMTDNETNQQAENLAGENELKSSWGAAYDQNIKVAQRAAQALGLDEATFDKMDMVLGYKGTLEMFHKIGSKITEDTFVSGGSQQNGFGTLSPAQAKAEINMHMQSPDTIKKLTTDPQFKQRWDQLHIWSSANA